jgi:zinc/manganese transport system permease protein
MTTSLIAVVFRATMAAAAATVFVSSVWLTVEPRTDQPLLEAFEHLTGLGTAHFLSPSDRATYEGAAVDALRFTNEADRLRARESAARAEGGPVADDEVQRIVSYRHSFVEMAQGERFVQEVLRARARERERFIVGAPAAMLSLVCLALLGSAAWRRASISRSRGRVASAPP